MKHMRIPSLALAALLCVPAAAAPAAAAEEPLSRAASAQQAIEAAAQYGGAVSIQYALWQDGAITMTGHAGAFSRTENRALTDQDLYGIGSVSKLYTTAALLQLCEAGKVDLDAPVTRYLPGFTMADERYRDITVRMLLNHSSGLMGDSTRSAFLFDAYTGAGTDDLLERLSTQRLKADPGAYSVYCNDGFTLAELVVEAVSGQDFTDYLRTHLLEEAGLTRTFTPADDFDRDDLARIYQGSDTRALPADTLNIIGAGGLYATASDLAAFGGLFCGDNDLLTDASWQSTAGEEYARGLWPEESGDDALAYGLGWDNVHMYPFNHSGIPALVKGGDTLYYHAGLIVLPEEDMAVAVVSSGGVSTYNQLAGVHNPAGRPGRGGRPGSPAHRPARRLPRPHARGAGPGGLGGIQRPGGRPHGLPLRRWTGRDLHRRGRPGGQEHGPRLLQRRQLPGRGQHRPLPFCHRGQRAHLSL